MPSVTTASLLGLLLANSPVTVIEPTRRSSRHDSALSDTLSLALLEADTRALLSAVDVEAVVTARVKTPQSLAAKAARKGISQSQVLDRLALRIRVDSERDCYNVMRRITDRFALVPGSDDDYIAEPKGNGYRSLHAAVHTPMGPVEFQVRTHQMHHEAEYGDASHLAYKAAQGLA
jgi:GTP pyrophosphokinase